MYMEDIYTLAVNLAGLPGISVPAGQINGRPVGLQILAGHFKESQLLNAAHQFQKATNWHQLAPSSGE
jgi:aspartyl-tRNA(Asn)/glutamyl-tRNA(Gln) amidotransferase subunit A